MAKLAVALAALVVLVSCLRPDAVNPVVAPFIERDGMTRLSLAELPGPPDIQAALAAQESALGDIAAHLSDAERAMILPILRGQVRDGYTYMIEGKTAEWKTRYARYYAALAHRASEERRAASVAAARNTEGAEVVLAMADNASSSVVTILVRPTATPTSLILLPPDASGRTVAAALFAFQRMRESFGDDVEDELILRLDEIDVAGIGEQDMVGMADHLRRLRQASPQLLSGVGTARSVSVFAPTSRLRTK